jgi:hypothetical protein
MLTYVLVYATYVLVRQHMVTYSIRAPDLATWGGQAPRVCRDIGTLSVCSPQDGYEEGVLPIVNDAYSSPPLIIPYA